MDIQHIIQSEISKAVKEVYDFDIAPSDVEIEHPDNEGFGDYASNLPLKIAKMLKQSPYEIARNVSYKMYDNHTNDQSGSEKGIVFKEINPAQPGFINIKLHENWLLDVLNRVLERSNGYGMLSLGSHSRIALEHSNVNPNKAAHVGHLRNAVIGQFIERAHEFLGYDVEVQYYANDVGLQVATSSLGIDTIKNIDPDDYEKYDHYAWDVYSAISYELETDKDLKARLNEIMIKIENPTSTESTKQAGLADNILQNQLETFASLGIDYDVIVHERDILYLDFWKTAFEHLKKNPNVYKAEEGNSKGCWLINLSSSKGKSKKEDIEEDKIIVRSNGVPTYTGKDIAYHMWKFGLLGKDFYYKKYSTETQEKTLWTTVSEDVGDNDITFTNADFVYNVIDVKQTYPIDVVKQSLRYLGFDDAANNMVHINYGFVYLSPATAESMGIDTSNGSDRYGMSGRRGWGIKIDDLIKMVDQTLENEHGSSKNLADVRNAAIKFEMLRYNTFQDVVFDIEEALNIKGFTGPYLQYTYARTCSLLDKAGLEVDSSILENVTPEDINAHEMAILRSIYKLPEIIKHSAKEFAPNHLCNYLFDLCQKYNYFYNEVPVLNETSKTKKDFRLALSKATGQVIKNGLYVLGINAPTRM